MWHSTGNRGMSRVNEPEALDYRARLAAGVFSSVMRRPISGSMYLAASLANQRPDSQFARSVYTHVSRGRTSAPTTEKFRVKLRPVEEGPDPCAAVAITGRCEPEVTETLRRFIAAGMTVVDVGANVGWYTLLSAQLVGPRGRVLSIEPEPRNFQSLVDSVTLNGFRNVEPIEAAVADFDGETALFLSRENPGGHSMVWPAVGHVNVRALTLDTILAQRGIPRADLVKIDVESAEPIVVRGSPRMFFGDAPPIVVMEFSPRSWSEEGDLLERLHSRFRMYELRGRFGRWHAAAPKDLSNGPQTMLYLDPRRAS